MYIRLCYFISLFAILFFISCNPKSDTNEFRGRTIVSIEGDEFLINGIPTYNGRTWNGNKIQGLLMNSRMVQGIFDDLNPETRDRWKYPDTGEWDPIRNTNEFIAAMPFWKEHGMLCFVINLQGGSPEGYSQSQPWINSAMKETGELDQDYMDRLKRILDEADRLEMVPMLGVFYFGQDERLRDEEAVIKGVDNTMEWLFDQGYRNVLIEVNNECDIKYDHEILQPQRVHELIMHIKSKERDGFRFLTSTSFSGGKNPTDEVIRESDFILLHGNGVSDPARIKEMVRKVRENANYSTKPIVFNEDDHYNYDAEENNYKFAVESYASWGYFDFRRRDEPFEDGYQSVPVDWSISSERKKAFFDYTKEITGY
jgi:hypothetical protein